MVISRLAGLDAHGVRKTVGLDGDYRVRDSFRNKLNEVNLKLVSLEMPRRHQGRSGHLILGHKKLPPRGKVAVRSSAVNRCGNVTGRMYS